MNVQEPVAKSNYRWLELACGPVEFLHDTSDDKVLLFMMNKHSDEVMLNHPGTESRTAARFPPKCIADFVPCKSHV